MLFRDRADAGRQLAVKLQHLVGRDVVVLALPRGGVPVAAAVARALHAPLDVFLVRKLGVPGHEELAMGAIASGGVRVLNDDVVAAVNVGQAEIERVAAAETRELDRRSEAYRGGRPLPRLAGRWVVLIDDGLATGASMRAAVTAVRQLGPARVVVAVPVGAPETCRELEQLADEVVCVASPDPFHAVGRWYQDFDQTSDDEVTGLLAQSSRE